MTAVGLFGWTPWTRKKRRVAPLRRGSVYADPAADGCVACSDEGGGVGVRKWSVRCAAAGWTPCAGHCRWSTGSPGRSSYHSPGPPNRHRPLAKTDKKQHISRNYQEEQEEKVLQCGVKQARDEITVKIEEKKQTQTLKRKHNNQKNKNECPKMPTGLVSHFIVMQRSGKSPLIMLGLSRSYFSFTIISLL